MPRNLLSLSTIARRFGATVPEVTIALQLAGIVPAAWMDQVCPLYDADQVDAAREHLDEARAQEFCVVS